MPRVHLTWETEALPVSRDRLKELLLEGEPGVFVRNSGANGIRVSAATLSEGQEMAVASKIRETLLRLVA